ncbi:putative mRNA 3-end processing factor [Catalinimonas alkaloidigena]|uniref:Putative mRNA 3-end processing factor n=1 Tax=Catalinimonas alkaloidigena TaxID=1075417 RepID=A0A1G9PQK2_9BACT|nr:ligase-associated DNA damage response exonuclease [Catalinimonas alkaloidigena]SDM00517.1 putative mRNA 3-end processing factor [Catalinimonas alkaloidigena]
MAHRSLLEFTDRGIYCAAGDFYIDPWQPVDRAVLTHAHADHARPGSRLYVAHHHSQHILRLRLGEDINLETVDYQEERLINGVRVSLHPAGHIRGSAQVRIEYKGEVWVVSGDYKTEPDGLIEAFEPVRCHSFVTESTFGLPVFRWQPQEELKAELNQWWRENSAHGVASCLFGYALGKAQRLLGMLDLSIGPVWVHGAVFNVNAALRQDEMALPEFPRITGDLKKDQFRQAMIVAPPSALNTPWMRKFAPYATGLASGWMAMRGVRRRRAVDRGFVLSDHADWDGLLETIRATEAEHIYVTHGYKATLARWLREQGWDAHEVDTLYTGERDEVEAAAEAELEG